MVHDFPARLPRGISESLVKTLREGQILKSRSFLSTTRTLANIILSHLRLKEQKHQDEIHSAFVLIWS